MRSKSWQQLTHLQVPQLVKGLHVELKVLLRRQLRRAQLAQHGCRVSQRLP